MGNIHSIEEEEAVKLFEYPSRVDESAKYKALYRYDVLSKFTVLPKDDILRQEVADNIFSKKTTFTHTESRAVASFLGMAIGDALGAPLEFSPVTYDHRIINGFADTDYWKQPYNNFALKPGQWTDDASMGLCLAESLLVHPEFNPLDLRVRFLNWWEFGYRNAFGYDEPKHSVGLGGSISMSFDEFETKKSSYTTAGDLHTSGNGSIMRLAAVPIFFHDDIQKAMEISKKQSKTTHQGDEAAECCRLMTFIIISFMECSEKLSFEERKAFVRERILREFTSPVESVECLALSKDEERTESNSKLNLEDRKWNWMSSDFQYSPNRAKQQPGYIGSYCMDGLSMALHCVWHTDSFEEALLKAINLRGDSDTVGAITGQIAGSLYGMSEIPLDWIEAIQQWDNNGDFAYTAIRLVRKLVC